MTPVAARTTPRWDEKPPGKKPSENVEWNRKWQEWMVPDEHTYFAAYTESLALAKDLERTVFAQTSPGEKRAALFLAINAYRSVAYYAQGCGFTRLGGEANRRAEALSREECRIARETRIRRTDEEFNRLYSGFDMA